MKNTAPGKLNHAPWRDYVGLTKPRIVLLLLFTTLVAMWLAGGGILNWPLVWWTALGGYLSAGGAGVINSYFDRDLDEQMSRTSHRAIPAGRIAPRRALFFGLALAVLSFFVLWLGTNALAASLGLLGLFHYVVVYTWWLKRRTPHNVVIGGVAGAVPPLVGWAAATGTLDAKAWVLAGIILAWTPPHFWALALLRRKEYELAGVPMLPVVRGDQVTRWAILVWTVLTVALSSMPLVTPVWGSTIAPPLSLAYVAAVVLLGGVFLGGAWQVIRPGKQDMGRRFYFYTIFYLGALFLCMALTLTS